MLLRERVGLHHMMPGMTTCEGQRVCPGLPLQFIIISIAYIHFTRLQGFSDNPLRVEGAAQRMLRYGFRVAAVQGGLGSSFGGTAKVLRVVLSSIRALPRWHRQCSSCKRDQVAADAR